MRARGGLQGRVGIISSSWCLTDTVYSPMMIVVAGPQYSWFDDEQRVYGMLDTHCVYAGCRYVASAGAGVLQ